MIDDRQRVRRFGTDFGDFETSGDVLDNLSPPALVEEAVRRGEVRVAGGGVIVAATGTHTGRAPKDRYVVQDESTADAVDWGSTNLPISPVQYSGLVQRVRRALASGDVFVRDAWCGADPDHRIGVRVATRTAWHNLFAANMFIAPSERELAGFVPDWTVLHAPEVQADPLTDGTNGETFIVISFADRTVVIGGTAYAGEIKKSIFSVMNFILPERGVLPMHCSANIGPDGDVALFFGLSGTGKTTLSADSGRRLIGDDEHGWHDSGVFNFEGGCYAKTIRITEKDEPFIFRAASRFGTILENVVLDPLSRVPDFDSADLTENTRASYPIGHLEYAEPSGTGGHPRNVVFLTADAFGVMPPISRLNSEQAMYHFLSGYTAKVAGTEKGVDEPTVTFSACFGAPFLPRHPGQYARLLDEKLARHDSRVWLVNTGWTGGPYGIGRRISLMHTRAMLGAALRGELDDVATLRHPIFGLHVPQSVPGVPDELMDPRSTWSDTDAYDKTASELAERFDHNYRQLSEAVGTEVGAAS